MIIAGGLIHDAVNRTPYVSDIAFENGKITNIASHIQPKSGEEVINANGLNVYPGLVDAHSHVGLDDYGLALEGSDYNEKNTPVTPYLRAIDSFYPQDKSLERALDAGVTTICTGPGSANALGGTFTAVKTKGTSVDKMTVKAECAMKCAFGENPKKIHPNHTCMTRMSVAYQLRNALFEAREYMQKKEAANGELSKMPKFDLKHESLIPVLKKQIPLKAHCHRADDICTAIRIAKEFDVNMTLEHVTEGYLIIDELKEAGFPLAVGPNITEPGKPETANKIYETAAILSKAGLKVSLITDAPVIQQDLITVCAAYAVKFGMDEFEALKAITINAAEHNGIGDRVGSLEVGKDADIIICDKDILDIGNNIKKVFLNGKLERDNH